LAIDSQNSFLYPGNIGRFVRGSDAERPGMDFVIGFVAISAVTIVAQLLSLGGGPLLWIPCHGAFGQRRIRGLDVRPWRRC
jgi:hypothetical protein